MCLFFTDMATTEIYTYCHTLSRHDALPIFADWEKRLQAARALLYSTAVKVTEGAADKTHFAAMAKRLATDEAMWVADRALQLHGGYGYLMDYPIERIYRDLRVHSILEGTNEVMRMIVGRNLVQQ